MTPVLFILNTDQRANQSVRRAGTGFAPASRNLKFISSARSSAKAV